jgi:hypothetical protein
VLATQKDPHPFRDRAKPAYLQGTAIPKTHHNRRTVSPVADIMSRVFRLLVSEENPPARKPSLQQKTVPNGRD